MKNLFRLLISSALLCMVLGLPSACSASTAVTVVGKHITISYTADGTPPFSQQWVKDGSPISGAMAPTYVILSAVASDAGVYTVIVSNPAGSSTSDTATLSFILAPSGVITGVEVTQNGVTIFYPLG